MSNAQLELAAALVRANIRALGMQAHNDAAKLSGWEASTLYTETQFLGVIESEWIDEGNVRARLQE